MKTLRKFVIFTAMTFAIIVHLFAFAPSVQAASLPSLRVGVCAKVVNSNRIGGLAVRSSYSTSASIIKRISDGAVIKLLEGPKTGSGYTWYRHDQGGWSATSYLQEVSCPTPVPTGPDINAARAKLRDMSAMKSPWTQVNAPLQSKPPRSVVWYVAVIEQFNVASSDFSGRYAYGGAGLNETRCNIFAGDVMRAMNAALPTKGQLGHGTGGAENTDPMTANASDIYKWLSSGNGGWRKVDATTKSGLATLIAHVSAGKPAVASNSSHISVIRPNQLNVTSWSKLRTAQAGAQRFLDNTLSSGFGSAQPAFFIHD